MGGGNTFSKCNEHCCSFSFSIKRERFSVQIDMLMRMKCVYFEVCLRTYLQMYIVRSSRHGEGLVSVVGVWLPAERVKTSVPALLL